MEQASLISLYEIAIKEGQFYLTTFEQRVSFFWKIISAILGAFLVGIFKATLYYHFIFLLIIPMLLFSISLTAKKALFRDYLSFIECISTRAKLEAELKLDKHKIFDTLNWKNESIIPIRHIQNRKKFNSSQEFIDDVSKKGILSVYENLFKIVQYVSILMGIILICLAKINYA